MRILVASFAMDAHFNGVVPLAWALRTAGHDVRVASQPSLVDSITRAGLTAVPVGADHDMNTVMRAVGDKVYAQHRDENMLEYRMDRLGLPFLQGWTTVMTATFFTQINDPMVDDLVDFAQAWRPDLVLWEPFTFAGPVAARACGAAHARVLWGPEMFLAMRMPYVDLLNGLPAERRDDPLAEWLGWTLDRYGRDYAEEVVQGHWTIDQMPASMRLSLGNRVVGMRYVPYNGPIPAIVPDWLREEPKRPRVCLTLGVTSRATEFPHAVALDDVFDGMADLDIEVIATLSAADQDSVSRLPDNVRVVEHVPMQALLPTCSAIVHHGGAGTWATAMAAGVPQVALGWMWDDIYRARRLEELGAGLAVPSESLTAQVLRDKLVRLLAEDQFREGAARLSAENAASPSPNEIVPQLEQLTREHRE